MKVLKTGRAQKGWSKQLKCSGRNNGGGGCGATLLVEQGDLFTTSTTDMGGDTDTFVTFKCMSCEVLTDLAPVELPPHDMQSQLPTKKQWERDHRNTAPAVGD
jgi:hypothetical protein